MSAEIEQRPTRFAALHYPNFTILWLGLLVSTAGSQMQQAAKYWVVLQQTNTPLSLAALGLCYTVPTLLLSASVTGPVADRFDRVALLKAVQGLGTVQPLLMALLLATGQLPLWCLFVDTIVNATVNAFTAPAQQALLPALVPRAALLSATSLQAAVWSSAQLIGPALGGTLLAALGAPWVFAINGLSTLAVLAGLFRLRDAPGHRATPTGAVPTPGSGLAYVWSDPVLRGLTLLATGIFLLSGGYQILLPLFARDVWHVGAQGYGLLLSAPGAGTIIATIVLAARGNLRRPATTLIGGALVLCGALVGFAHAPSYPLGLALLVLVGGASAASGTVLVALLQVLAPDGIRGRVMAVRYMASVGMSYTGGLVASGLATPLGPGTTLTIGSVALLLATIALRRLLSEAEQAATGEMA